MAIANSKFITTEPLGKSGQRGEGKVWEAVKSAFAERNCIGYWRYPIFSKVGQTRKEPDILIADFEIGLIIIEVKSVTIDQVVAINGHQWEFKNFYTSSSNPYEQAENQLFGLLGYCDREPALRRQVSGRVLVALPLITQQQWQLKGFDKLPSCPPILFQDHIQDHICRGNPPVVAPEQQSIRRGNPPVVAPEQESIRRGNPPVVALLQQIQQTPPVIKGSKLNDERWKLLQAVLGGMQVFRKRRPLITTHAAPPAEGTRAWVLTQVQQQLSELDLQQEHIGKQILGQVVG